MLVTKFGLYKWLSSRKLPRLMDVLMDGDILPIFFLNQNSSKARMKIGEAFNQGMHGIAKKAIGCP